MSKTLAVLASSAFLGAAGIGVGLVGCGVAAASPPAPVLNTPSCVGLATAATAQGAIGGGPGIGNVARFLGLVPPSPHTITSQTGGVAFYCATGIIG
jgi:hypothetical protein